MATNIVDLVNSIVAEGPNTLKEYIPTATLENINDVATPILNYESVLNDFISTLANKAIFGSIVKNNLNNRLAPLKKKTVPLAFDVEEWQVNRAKGKEFNRSGTNLLSHDSPPDAVVTYHRTNRKQTYSVDLEYELLKFGFTGWSNLETVYNYLVGSLANGDSDDEFILMKNLMGQAVVNGDVTSLSVDYIIGADGKISKDAIEALVADAKIVSSGMTFANSIYNKYAALKPGETARRNRTDWEDLVIILRNDIAQTQNVNYWASVFNLDPAAYQAQVIITDDFGVGANVGAFICDRQFFQVYDKMRRTNSFLNASNLCETIYHHVFQVMGYSVLCNAAAIVFPEVALTVTTNNTNTVAGKTVEGATVTVYNNFLPIGSAKATTGGSYSVDISAASLTANTEVTVITSYRGSGSSKVVKLVSA